MKRHRRHPGTARAEIVCILAGILAYVLFFTAHNSMDRRDPATGDAVTLYVVIVAVTVLATVLTAWQLRPALPSMLWSLAVGLPVALAANALGTAYESDFGAVMFLLGLLALALGVILSPFLFVPQVISELARARKATRNTSERPKLASLGVMFGLGVSLGMAAASLHILATLPTHVEAARAAHAPSSPGMGLLGALAALLVALLFLQRARGRQEN